MKRIISVFILLVIAGTYTSCSIKLNGASIPAGMKTVNIDVFENNALFVVTNLSNDLTEALKDRIRTQTSLSITRNAEADALFSGAITNYTIVPISVQATGNTNAPPIANASRLSITVKVKYVDQITKKGFEQDFTKTADFTGDIASQEQGLIKNINKQLTDDIFNKAFADWQ
jgi:hypothetical protein